MFKGNNEIQSNWKYLEMRGVLWKAILDSVKVNINNIESNLIIKYRKRQESILKKYSQSYFDNTLRISLV
jgi:hypothetical protein